jgi:hypothetical protein
MNKKALSRNKKPGFQRETAETQKLPALGVYVIAYISA